MVPMTTLGEGGVWVGSFTVNLFSQVVLDTLQTFVCRDLGTQWENAWHRFLSDKIYIELDQPRSQGRERPGIEVAY